MTSCDTKLLGHSYIFGEKYLMSVTDDIGQTPCSLEHYLVKSTVDIALLCYSIFIILKSIDIIRSIEK